MRMPQWLRCQEHCGLCRIEPIPHRASCSGTEGDTGAVRPHPAGRKGVRVMGIMTWRGVGGLSSQGAMAAAKKDEQRDKLHKVNLAVSFLSKFELVESLCHVNPLCCAAEFSYSSFFFNPVAGMPVLDLLFDRTAAWEKKQRQQMLTCCGSGLEGFHSRYF